jgi:uncharacterized membrane protein HdeD (DUF308 family)
MVLALQHHGEKGKEEFMLKAIDRRSVLNWPEQLTPLGRHWAWVLTAGLAYITLGIVALSWPITSTVSLTFVLGALFVAIGLLQTIHCIRLGAAAGNGWRIFQALAALVAGGLILRYPEAGMLGIAITMAFYFFVSAAAKGAIAWDLRPHSGWGWQFTSAVASFFLGAFIIATFPFSAIWVPGIILGIDLIVMGASLVGFSVDLKNVQGAIEQVKAAEKIDDQWAA